MVAYTVITTNCQKCGKNEATENWVGQGSMMDFVHGNYQRWCKGCTLREQLKYAKKEQKQLVKRIPKLEKELERWLKRKEKKP